MSNQEIDITFVALAFIAIFIGIAIAILFGIFMSRKNNIVQQRLEEQLSYQERLHQSELKALRSQMNPHFVHNSLNAIQYYIQRNEVEISEDYLVKFSKLIRLFFDFSRRQSISVKEELSLLENYLYIEQLRFEENLLFEIILDPKIDAEEQILPPMLIQPIVENAVNHGLFHKKGVGTIHIHFHYINEFAFKITIEDDGIGINKAKKMFSNSTKNYQSHSSDVLQERIDLLNQSKKWIIDYKIQDKEELENKNTNLAGKTGTIAMLSFNQNNL